LRVTSLRVTSLRVAIGASKSISDYLPLIGFSKVNKVYFYIGR
jgi:hypothetical protein